jgi:hypothetical protein
MAYTTPAIADYGTMRDLTLATGFFGSEDGATKMIPNHHDANPPSVPVGP